MDTLTGIAPPTPIPAAAIAPWHRQLWPWLLIGGPAAVVVAGFITAYIAWYTDDGVVAEDYYKRGLLINRSLEREASARALHLGAALDVDAGGNVRVELRGGDATADPPALTLRFAHATRAGLDRAAVLEPAGERRYRGHIDPPPPGRWIVNLETDAWRLPSVEIAGRIASVEFGAMR